LKAGARLHLQVIDPTGISGFKLGGIGLSLKEPNVEIIVTTAKTIREQEFIQDTKYIKEITFEKHLSTNLQDFNVFFKSSIPRHVGLGSGTIHRTLLRKALQKISNTSKDIFQLSSLTGVGQYSVLNGGLVLVSPIPKNNSNPIEAFRGETIIRPSQNLIGSFAIPTNWQTILCIPREHIRHELYSDKETYFYENLPSPSVEELRSISFDIISKLIPAVNSKDFQKFEEALKTITCLGWKKYEKDLFREYWNKTSSVLYEIGAHFVATSSNGPTTYTFFDTDKIDKEDIFEKLNAKLENDCYIVLSEINNDPL
jgi:beta-RFAP synthase